MKQKFYHYIRSRKHYKIFNMLKQKGILRRNGADRGGYWEMVGG